jgi:TusA-related sulfurtransferase
VSARAEVDARGLSCPLPALRTRIALRGRPAALEVLVSTGAARTNVEELLLDEGYEVTIREEGDDWRVTASRGG